MKDDFFNHLRNYALSIFKCDPDSVHGPLHWRNVDDSGKLICAETPADLIVVRFFAYLHDSARLDDGADLDHGPRAADRLADLPGHLSLLAPAQMDLLEYAIRHHTDGEISDDPIIGACWDSDRLDLGRVGIPPSESLMSTGPGKEIARMGSKYLYMAAKEDGSRGVKELI